MSGAAKFIVATIGGGLLLGAIGGHLANPVMQQRGGEEPWRDMLGPDRTGTFLANAPSQEPRPYGGSRSYAPAFADDPIAIWPDPYADAEWHNGDENYVEPPTIAELDARWKAGEPETRVYGRTVEFPQVPAIERTAEDMGRAAGEPRMATEADDSSNPTPEPRVAGGKLPAIW